MQLNKKTICIFLTLVVIIVIGISVTYKIIENNVTNREDYKFQVKNISSSPVDTKNNETNWEEITKNGVDEEKLIENVDVDTLERIATLLQELTREIEEKEKEDYQFAVSASWYKYTLESSQFNEVLNIGNNALKPLYLIIYKSPKSGLYEYICSMALEEISKVQIDNWNNSKDFLEKFNKEVINKE